ncbi:Uncharacterised protein [Bordetella pertussis]|nr:Uncharacterised protein [Bordetella pertussis]
MSAWLTAGWLRCSAVAARPTPRSCTTNMKVRNRFQSRRSGASAAADFLGAGLADMVCGRHEKRRPRPPFPDGQAGPQALARPAKKRSALSSRPSI